MWFELVFISALLVLGPLAIVWFSKEVSKYGKLIGVTLFLTFDLIVFGAFTRLTDSGLGCPDWPGCYGHGNTLSASRHIAEAAALMPTGPVTMLKANIEMIHRYLAMMVGLLILILVCWSVIQSRKNKTAIDMFSLMVLFLVCLQGAFGAFTVLWKLQPIIVTTHLLLGLSLLAVLTWFYQRENVRVEGLLVDTTKQSGLQTIVYMALGLLVLQIALGGWVSTNYAVLACSEFPLCQGAFLPRMDFQDGFSLWRELGKNANGEFLRLEALVAIHWTHRCMAFMVIPYLIFTAIQCAKVCQLLKWVNLLFGILLLQLITGIANIYFGWPLLSALLHSAGAAGLVVCLVSILSALHISSNQKYKSH